MLLMQQNSGFCFLSN